MKTSLIPLVASLAILSFVSPAMADGTNKTMLEQAKAGVLEASGETNLQSVVVDILRGAKNASGEIYQASKAAIVKSVDFAVEQTPLVVKEFLHWRMAQAIIYIVIGLVACGFTLWLAQLLMTSVEKDSDCEGVMVAWMVRVVCGIVLIAIVSVNAMTITKICIAPRVYLIEYVVSQIHGK